MVDRECDLNRGLSGHDMESLTLDHSGPRLLRATCSMHVQDLLSRFQKSRCTVNATKTKFVILLQAFLVESNVVSYILLSLPHFYIVLYIVENVILNIAEILAGHKTTINQYKDN